MSRSTHWIQMRRIVMMMKSKTFIQLQLSVIQIFSYVRFRYNILNENDIEGEEDGIAGMDGEVKVNSLISY